MNHYVKQIFYSSIHTNTSTLYSLPKSLVMTVPTSVAEERYCYEAFYHSLLQTLWNRTSLSMV